MQDAELLAIQRTALTLRETAEDGPGRLVLVTSARPAEGKSLYAGLLARALAAQEQGEVLLIDAGRRDPPEALGAGAGLRGLLRGAELAAVVGRVEGQPGLWQLPRGEGYSVGDLFKAGHWRAALQRVRQRFPIAVIDGPELDACGALLALSDRSVLVVDASRTPGSIVRSTVDGALAAAGVPRNHLAGVLLNRQSSGLPRWLGG